MYVYVTKEYLTNQKILTLPNNILNLNHVEAKADTLENMNLMILATFILLLKKTVLTTVKMMTHQIIQLYFSR